MSNQLQIKGAQSTKPVHFAPLFTDRMFQGLWTQRNPFRDAGSTRIEEAFYGARGDALLDGSNVEISTRLTVMRRPGNSVYNSQIFPPIQSFYEFRLFSNNLESIRVMADSANVLYDATGPSTQTAIWTKSAGAGQTYMQSVGNTLYFGNGVDQEKWVQSALKWVAQTNYTQGQYIVDTNNNLQLAIGGQVADIESVQITSGVLTVFFNPATSFTDLPIGVRMTFAGLTAATFLNNVTVTVTAIPNSSQIQANFSHPDYSDTADTGTAEVGNGNTSSKEPIWATATGAITQEGGVDSGLGQWVCRGPSVQQWGISPPAAAPTVTQSAAPAIYPEWTANAWYGPSFVIVDSNGNVQQLTTGGVTGPVAPAWSRVPRGTTADNTCVWTNKGSAIRQVNTNYAVNAYVSVTWTYYITVYTPGDNLPGREGPPQYQRVPITTTAFFQCVTAGKTSTTPTTSVAWSAGTGTVTHDGTVVWKNVGANLTWATFGAAASLELSPSILDSNKNIQTAQITGESGASAPVWSKPAGSYTADNTVSWLNQGPFGSANTGAWIYGYSYANSVTGHVSTSSPESLPITVSLGNQAVIQGVGSSDPQADTIWLWRTVQGGSILLYLDTIPNPGANQSWIYTDTTPDTGLDNEIEAPIALSNNPPPVGLTALTYYLGRVWGKVGNTVYFSNGPDTTVGSGNESFPPANSFVYPETVVRLWPCTLGMVVFTNAQPFLISGIGTASSPFVSIPYLTGPGLLSYNAFDVNGSVPYFMTSDSQVVSFDPSSGVSEVGFPIGDQFLDASWDPATTYVAWHVYTSTDKGIYVANSNGWFRLMPTPSPESGLTWCPFASLTGGCSAVQNVETSPGIPSLLIGPKTSGPILKRDLTVWTDNGEPYDAWFTFGSFVPAQPGQVAMIDFITTDSVKIGKPLTLSVQLDEIGTGAAALFEDLAYSVPDLTQKEPSATLYGQRFYLSQTLQPAICRSLQMRVDFGTDTVQNELLNFCIFGGFAQEK